MFAFLKNKNSETRYMGERVDLVYRCRYNPEDTACLAECIEFRIVLHATAVQIGYCDLRFGMNDILYYAGNIGYRIYPPYRGHHYAKEATELLLHVAFHVYDIKRIIITCSPDNIPSVRTLEQIPGYQFLETVNVPQDHWLYKRGETVKNIYMYIKEEEGRC